MSEIIKVGMADLKTCVSPDGVTTLGLGSCVGIAIRDPVRVRQEWLLRLPVALPCLHFRVVTT